jgi:hypothetical protein
MQPSEERLMFGGRPGTVSAADDWDRPRKTLKVKPSQPNAWEGVLHDTGIGIFALDLRDPKVKDKFRVSVMGLLPGRWLMRGSADEMKVLNSRIVLGGFIALYNCIRASCW